MSFQVAPPPLQVVLKREDASPLLCKSDWRILPSVQVGVIPNRKLGDTACYPVMKALQGTFNGFGNHPSLTGIKEGRHHNCFIKQTTDARVGALMAQHRGEATPSSPRIAEVP